MLSKFEKWTNKYEFLNVAQMDLKIGVKTTTKHNATVMRKLSDLFVIGTQAVRQLPPTGVAVRKQYFRYASRTQATP